MNIPSNWTFKNNGVAGAFDRHVREQLPWYDLATGAVGHLARHYIGERGLVYDIGASTGNISRAIEGTCKARHARVVSIEPSEPMCARFAGYGALVKADALAYDFEPYDVAVCFLTVMFMPVAARVRFLRDLYKKAKPGGALIVFDKTEIGDGYLTTVLHRLTIAGKVSTGCKADDIIAKELSLGGVQRPLPRRFMEYALPLAVEVFRFGEFAGYIIEGPSIAADAE